MSEVQDLTNAHRDLHRHRSPGSKYFHIAQLVETSAFKFKLEHVSVEVEQFINWFEEKVPATHRLSEELWDLPLVMYYKTHGDDPVNSVAETLLKLQSETGTIQTPRGTAVFLPKSATGSISQELFDKLEVSLVE